MAAFSERSCPDSFHKFKNDKVDIEDQERSGRSKVAELEELFEAIRREDDTCNLE